MRIRMALATAAVTLFSPLLLAGTAQAATPVAIWHMESVGTMTDSSGNLNNGTTTNVKSIPDGKVGNAYRFGPTSSVKVPNKASLNPGTADITISANVRFPSGPNATTGDYDLIRKGLSTTSGGEWKIEIFPNSTLTSPAYCLFKDDKGKSIGVRGTTNLAGPDWHTITCAKTSTNVTLSVDGTSQRIVPAALGSISNTAAVSLGRKLGGGDQYVGDMDEVQVTIGPAAPVDGTPPTLTSGTPTGTGVAVSTNVVATFSEPVTGVDGATFTLTPAGGTTGVAASVTGSGTQWTLDPSGDLSPGVQYTVNLTGGTSAIRDLANNALASTGWSFTTAAPPVDGTPPTLTSGTPTGTSVAVSTNVVATFSEPVTGVDGATFTLTPAGGTTGVAASVTGSGTQWTLDPSGDLSPGVQYTVNLTGGTSAIRDLANNALASTGWSFTTAPATADVPPTVTVTTPTGKTVSLTANVTATFSETVTNVTVDTFYLTPDSGPAVPAVVSYNSNLGRWVLNPIDSLAPNTHYTATVTTGVVNSAGVHLAQDVHWSFTTGT